MSFKKLAMDVHKKKWTISATSSDYSILTSDLESCKILDSPDDRTFTLPNVSADYVGRRMRCGTIGLGRLAIKPYTGGNLQGSDMLVSDVPNSFIELVVTGANAWEIFSNEGYQENGGYGGWKLLGGNGYNYCNKITIDNTKVSGSSNHSNFPILIREMGKTYLKTTGNGGKITDSNGYDIIFTTDITGDTKLDHEIESYNGTDGNFIAWVKIPTLKYNEDTIIYMFYNNSSISSSQQNVSGVWSNNFDAVWHLRESGNGTADEYLDSSGNNNDGQGGAGTAANTPTRVSGVINYAQSFDGNDLISMGNTLGLGNTDSVTYSALIKTNTANEMQIMGRANATSWRGTWVFIRANGTIAFFAYDVSANELSKRSTKVVRDNTWHLIHVTYNGNEDPSGINIYVDGSLAAVDGTVDDSPGDINPGTVSFNIGAVNDDPTEYPYTDLIAESRVVGAVRSADWIATESNNIKSPETFYGVELWQ